MLVLPDWYVSVSIALDAEEEEWHNRQFLSYLAAGGDPKKFPKRRKPYTVPAEEEVNVHKTIMGALGVLEGTPAQIGAMRGNVDEVAKVRGLQKVYEMPDGTFVDKDGNRIEPDAGSIFVKSKGGQ